MSETAVVGLTYTRSSWGGLGEGGRLKGLSTTESEDLCACFSTFSGRWVLPSALHCGSLHPLWATNSAHPTALLTSLPLSGV